MKIKFIKNVLIKGERVLAGTEIDAEKAMAEGLIKAGLACAIEADEPAEPAKAEKPTKKAKK